MSLTKRVCSFYSSLELLIKSGTFNRYLVFTLAFFLCIGVFLNSYTIAQHAGYDHLDMYKEGDEFSTEATGVAGKHSTKSQHFQLGDATAVMLDITYPQGNVNYANIVANPNISAGAKLGIIGGIDIPVTAILYNPPSIDVVEHLAQEWIPNYDSANTGIYASSGYARLQSSGITDLWLITRNIAYLLFVIVFIVAGFMVMFRHKLGGQTMVTLYNTLPSVIVGLVLVTFSFAIVGIILDFGAVFIRIISGFLDIKLTFGADSIDPTKPFGIWGSYTAEITKLMLANEGIIAAFTDGIMGYFGWVLKTIFSTLVGGLLIIVMSIIIAYASIKIFLALVKAYVAILFDTIMAPIILAIATIPGKNGLMKDWFNRILKNVMVFVVVFLLVNLPVYFMQNDYKFDIFGGNLVSEVEGDGGWFVWKVVMASVAIYMLFLAGNASKLLDEYFPQTKGQATGAGVEAAKKDMAKIPGFGGLKG